MSLRANSESQDFIAEGEGTTTQFYQAGLISAALAGVLPRVPDGQVLLRPGWRGHRPVHRHGASAQTLWVPDTGGAVDGWEPIIAGTDTRGLTPYVMTAGRANSPISTLELASPASNSQYWYKENGVL